MNKLKALLPNLLTLGNLLCGCLAIYFITNNIFSEFVHYPIYNFKFISVYLILFALILDFLDGFVARLLNVSGELGAQLDSLADMVSFGVVPGFIMFHLMGGDEKGILPFIAFLIPLGAAYRLAKFNIDTEQSVNFKGLATPAMTLFVIGLWFLNIGYHLSKTNNIILFSILSILLVYLMVSNLPLFSLKAKNFTWKDNWFRYMLIIVSVCLLAWLNIGAFALIIPIYILLSIVARKSFIEST